MKRKLCILIAFFVLLIFVYQYLYERWKPLWRFEKPRQYYSILHYQDDTLRIVMIGDSWAGMRTDSINNLFKARLSKMIGKPVVLKTKGKGGEESRGIYQLMFKRGEDGTKSLFLSGADYCVVFAGINDAASNYGKKQYTYHMKLILNFLQENKIRPIIVEIPDVNIWTVYGEKPYKDLIGDYLKSTMTGCGMYHFSEYRKALQLMLEDNDLFDAVLYVPMKGWNGNAPTLNAMLFLDDQIHLNQQGYIKLDSCICDAICHDLK